MDYYLAIIRDELMIHTSTRVNLKIIMLSERCQRSLPKESMFSFILKITQNAN